MLHLVVNLSFGKILWCNDVGIILVAYHMLLGCESHLIYLTKVYVLQTKRIFILGNMFSRYIKRDKKDY